MAARKTQTHLPGPPTLGPSKALELLADVLQKGTALSQARPISADDHSAWELVARNILERAFGEHSPNVHSVTLVGHGGGAFPLNAGEEWWENRRAENLKTQLSRLEGLMEVLRTEAQLTRGEPPTAGLEPSGHRIFLVHGHDDGLLHEVARFCERLRQQVLILREQPDRGRTIIEKFEQYADVGFAIIMLTADDSGCAAGSGSPRPRARQNVVLELGYFLGRLGRSRVCALHKDGVEIPSDYSGILYVAVDQHGAWRLSLARELKAAGFPVDMNLAL